MTQQIITPDVHITYNYTSNLLTAMCGSKIKTTVAVSTDIQSEADELAVSVSGRSNLVLVMYSDDVFVYR